MALIVFNKDYSEKISVLRACGVVNGWIVHSTAGALVVHPVVDDLHQGDLGVGLPKNRDGQVSVDLRNGSTNMESTVSKEDSNIVPIAVNHLFEISSLFLYFFAATCCVSSTMPSLHSLAKLPGVFSPRAGLSAQKWTTGSASLDTIMNGVSTYGQNVEKAEHSTAVSPSSETQVSSS